MTDGIGRRHFETAQKLLAAVTEERDADWAQVTATMALAHAQLAAAARDYGLHVAPRHPSQAEEPRVFNAPTVADPTVVIPHTRFDDKLRARDVAELNRLLVDDD